jgi:hypothetical protein
MIVQVAINLGLVPTTSSNLERHPDGLADKHAGKQYLHFSCTNLFTSHYTSIITEIMVIFNIPT